MSSWNLQLGSMMYMATSLAGILMKEKKESYLKKLTETEVHISLILMELKREAS